MLTVSESSIVRLVTTRRPVAEAAAAVERLGLGDGDDVGGDGLEAEVLEQVLGLLVDVELAGLGLGKVERRDLGHVLVLALTLLLLELEGDTSYGPALDALHEMGGVAGNLAVQFHVSPLHPPLFGYCSLSEPVNLADLVPEALRRDDGDLIADLLVGLEIEREAGIYCEARVRQFRNTPSSSPTSLRTVPLNDDLGGLFDRLGTNATHCDGFVLMIVAGCGSSGEVFQTIARAAGTIFSGFWRALLVLLVGLGLER